MKPGLDTPVTTPETVSAEAVALANWYDANPAVRRLWGIREARTLRVAVSLESTHDGDDIYPAWLAHCQAWARELQRVTGRTVQLELVGESPLGGIEFHAEGTIVADLFWRDATLIPPHTAG